MTTDSMPGLSRVTAEDVVYESGSPTASPFLFLANAVMTYVVFGCRLPMRRRKKPSAPTEPVCIMVICFSPPFMSAPSCRTTRQPLSVISSPPSSAML